MNAEINRCPFCAGVASLVKTSTYGWAIECQECGANIRARVTNNTKEDVHKHLVKKWNIRNTDFNIYS